MPGCFPCPWSCPVRGSSGRWPRWCSPVLHAAFRPDDPEANLNYRIGSSFDTITKDLLGKGWNLVNGLSIAFVLYILTYAYISASGSILHHTFSEMSLNVPARLAGLFFAMGVAFIVWMSTKAVSRMTAIVLGAKVITFFLTFGSLLGHVTPATLFNVAEVNTSYTPYLLMTLPFCLASFGYHGNVPSLMKYYGRIRAPS